MSSYLRHAVIRHPDRVAARGAACLVLLLHLLTLPLRPLPQVEHRDLARAESLLEGLPEVLASQPLPLTAGQGTNATQGLGHTMAWVAVPPLVLGKLQESLMPAGVPWEPGEPRPWQSLWLGLREILSVSFLAWLVVLTSRRMGAPRHVAWLSGVALGATTFLWPAARVPSSEVLVACTTFSSFYCLLRLRELFDRFRSPSRRVLFGIGASTALAIWIDALLIPAALVLLVVTLGVLRSGQRRLASLNQAYGSQPRIGIWALWVYLPPVLVLVRLLVAGGMQALELGLPDGSGSKLTALWLAPNGGLLASAPLLLLALLGALRAPRYGQGLWLRTTVALAVALTWRALLRSNPQAQGLAFGPLFLLPLLPYLWLGLPLMIGQRWALRAAAVLCALGLWLQLPAVLVHPATDVDLARQVRYEASPWSLSQNASLRHWRILRQRVSGRADRFSAAVLYGLPEGGELRPSRTRLEGWRHLAWPEFERNGHLPVWALILGSSALLLVGGRMSALGLIDE